MQKINLQQAPKLPTEPSDMKPTDLLPFRISSSSVWKWFRLAKNVEYSKNKTAHSEYQRACCFKCLSDGIDPMQASVVYHDSTQGTSSMTNHISKKHTGEHPLINVKAKRNAESSESDSQGIKIHKCNLLTSCNADAKPISRAAVSL